MSKDFDKWEERAKKNTEIIEQQQTKTKMGKEENTGCFETWLGIVIFSIVMILLMMIE